MPLLKIVRGVPAKKAENAFATVEVRESALVIEGGNSWGQYPYRLAIPVRRMTEIVVDEGRRISAMRVVATGVIGLLWKKGVYYLVIAYDWAGTSSTVVLTGKQDELAHLHGRLMRAKEVTGGPADVEFEASDRPKSASAGELVFAIIAGLILVGLVLWLADSA